MKIFETIKGSVTSVLVDSSNLLEIAYDRSNSTMTVVFKNNKLKYEYYDVTHEKFIKLIREESTGKAFNQMFGKNRDTGKYPYDYKNLGRVDTTLMVEQLNKHKALKD